MIHTYITYIHYIHTCIHTYIRECYIHTCIDFRAPTVQNEVAVSGLIQEGQVEDHSETKEKKMASALRALAVHVTLRERNDQLRHLTLRVGFSLLRTAARHAREVAALEGKADAAAEKERKARQERDRNQSVAEKRILQEKQRSITYVCMYVCMHVCIGFAFVSMKYFIFVCMYILSTHLMCKYVYC